MRAFLCSTICGIAVSLASLSAVAEEQPAPYPECSRQPTEVEVAAAKGAFQAGQASFNEADYNRAITYWEDAYRRDCTAHALLLNLARAYELNGQKHHAVNSLETYLARNPSSPQRDQIARRIEVLNDKIAQEEKSAAPASGTPGGSDSGSGTGDTKPGGGPGPDTGSEGKRSIVPLFVAGGGGAIAIVGGILYFGAASDVTAAEDKCGGRKCPPGDPAIKEGNDARSRQTVATIVTVGGLAIAGGGVAWYFLQKPEGAEHGANKPPRRTTAVIPAVGPGFAGLNLSGSF